MKIKPCDIIKFHDVDFRNGMRDQFACVIRVRSLGNFCDVTIYANGMIDSFTSHCFVFEDCFDLNSNDVRIYSSV